MTGVAWISAQRSGLWFAAVLIAFALYMVGCFTADVAVLSVVPVVGAVVGLVLYRVGLVKAGAAISICAAPLFMYGGALPGVPFTLLEAGVASALVLALPLVWDSRALAAWQDLPQKPAIVLLAFGVILAQVYSLAQEQRLWLDPFYYNVKVLLWLAIYASVFALLYSGVLQLHHLMYCIVVAGVVFVAAGLSIYAKDGVLHLLFFRRFGIPIDVSPNISGSLLDLVFPIALFSGLGERRRKLRVLLLGLSGIYLWCIFQTYSRGSLLGLMPLGFYFLRRGKKKIRLLLVGILLVAYVAMFGEGLWTRFSVRDLEAVRSNLGRVELLLGAYNMVNANNWILGPGMNAYATQKFEYGVPRWFDAEGTMSTHNQYVEYLVGLGVFGLIGATWLLLGLLYKLIRRRCGGGDEHLRRGLIFALLAYAVHGLVGCAIYYFAVSFILWVVLGCSAFLVVSCATNNETKGEAVA